MYDIILNGTSVPSLVTAIPEFEDFSFYCNPGNAGTNLVLQTRLFILNPNPLPSTIIKGISLYFNELTQNEWNLCIFEVNLGYLHIIVHFFLKKSGICPKQILRPPVFFPIFCQKMWSCKIIFPTPQKNWNCNFFLATLYFFLIVSTFQV